MKKALRSHNPYVIFRTKNLKIIVHIHFVLFFFNFIILSKAIKKKRKKKKRKRTQEEEKKRYLIFSPFSFIFTSLPQPLFFFSPMSNKKEYSKELLCIQTKGPSIKKVTSLGNHSPTKKNNVKNYKRFILSKN